MRPSVTTASLPPSEIGQYRISRTLTPEQTYVAIAPGGREVVLKMIDGDCLLRGQLHPSIHERLSRVRELAHIGVANLYGVERGDGRVFAVWEYIGGKTLDEYARQVASPEDLARLAREIILAVEALHALGIVHGRIHAGNVFVDDRGRIRLTHISPLLYDDPLTDAHNLAEMLKRTAIERGWADCAVAIAAGAENSSPAKLRVRVSNFAETLPANSGENRGINGIALGSKEKGPRSRLLLLAGIVLISGVGIAWGLLRVTAHSGGSKITPPEASPQALQETGR